VELNKRTSFGRCQWIWIQQLGRGIGAVSDPQAPSNRLAFRRSSILGRALRKLGTRFRRPFLRHELRATRQSGHDKGSQQK
jgi:hypothetical protein